MCDTGPWPDVFADSGSVDVVVTITEGFKTYERTCWNCFRYYAVDGALSPRLRRVSPRHAGEGEPLHCEMQVRTRSFQAYRSRLHPSSASARTTDTWQLSAATCAAV